MIAQATVAHVISPESPIYYPAVVTILTLSILEQLFHNPQLSFVAAVVETMVVFCTGVI